MTEHNAVVSESATLTKVTESADAKSGLLEVEFITPGWGSSGYYSSDVVAEAAPLFKAGTQMYLDHPSATESNDRPERSVRDLAAVIVEAGHVDPVTKGVRGKVKAFAPYRELLTDPDFAENIGLSIRGSATDVKVGEAEGRTGQIIEGLADITSVDFVTRAGRGGKVLQVLESYAGAVTPTTPGDTTYTNTANAGTTTSSFTLSSNTGGNQMGQEITVSEADHRTLTEAANRVPVLEAERDAAIRERDEARAETAKLTRLNEARTVMDRKATDAGVRFSPLEEKGLTADLPTREDGTLDTDKFTATVDDAVTEAAKRVPAGGTVYGFGSTGTAQGSPGLTESDIDNDVAAVFGRTNVKG